MQVLVPIAAGSAFFPAEEFHFPKPLIEVSGQPMIQHVTQNLDSLGQDVDFVFAASATDIAGFSLDKVLHLLCEGRSQIVPLNNETKGALCTCLLTISHLREKDELIVSNGDQVIDIDLTRAVDFFRSRQADAGVIVFQSIHPRWSYVEIDSERNVVRAEEKQVISKNAIAGFYYFRESRLFIEAAKETIRSGRTFDDRYYIAPSLNELILAGKSVVAYKIDADRYHSFYSPSKIDDYEDQAAEPVGLSPVLNVLIPAAGDGSRFVAAGMTTPKPFIDVGGRKMIDLVVENLHLDGARTTILFREQHLESAPASASAEDLSRAGCYIQTIDTRTEGTACTALLARERIDNSTPLLIANSDQLVEFSLQDFVRDCLERDLDGSILVFRDPSKNPKWSFAQVDNEGLVSRVAEKEPISDLATVGIYLFRQGHEFVSFAAEMIANNDRTNNEFYTCPVYNYFIRAGRRIGIYEVPADAMTGLGTPEDLTAYLGSHQAGR